MYYNGVKGNQILFELPGETHLSLQGSTLDMN